MDLVGPVDEAHRAPAGPHGCEGELLADAAAAVGLDRRVDDAERHGGHVDLGRGDLDERVLGVELVDLGRRVEHHEARRVDLDPAVRDALEGRALRREELAKGRAGGVVGARDEVLERLLRLCLALAPGLLGLRSFSQLHLA